jgi:hypothetical protein
MKRGYILEVRTQNLITSQLVGRREEPEEQLRSIGFVGDWQQASVTLANVKVYVGNGVSIHGELGGVCILRDYVAGIAASIGRRAAACIKVCCRASSLKEVTLIDVRRVARHRERCARESKKSEAAHVDALLLLYTWESSERARCERKYF